jgi:hypothetical protein
MTFLSALIVVPVMTIFTGTLLEKVVIPVITYIAT